MKLRIKYKDTRTVVEVTHESSVGDVVQACISQLSLNGSVQLSLNGADVLLNGEKVSNLGIVSGDLLYLIDGSQQSEVPSGSHEPLTGSTITQSKPQTQQDNQVASFSKVQQKKLNSKLLLQNFINRLDNPIAADFIFLAVHAFMLEAGYKTASNTLTSDTKEDDMELPLNWRIESMKLYKITYHVYGSYNCNCDITATLTGTTLFVSGYVENQSNTDVVQMSVKIDDVIDTEHLPSKNAFLIYKNLDEFKKIVMQSIIQNLSSSIKKVEGDELKTLLSLPYEVQLRIVKFLKMKSVCLLGQVCKAFRDLCNDDEVWKKILVSEFGSYYCSTDDKNASFKDSVIRLYRARKEQERIERERPRPPLRPEFEVPTNMNYPSFTPQRIPGMIGGSYDLYPAGGFQPGPFQPGPFQPPDVVTGRHPLRQPPGARYDPIGPFGLLSDDEHRRLRQTHPDLIRRPDFYNRFGRGGGFI